MNKDKIMGGAFILARQIFTSPIWQDKPATWKIIWIYIVGQVNHKTKRKFNRGEGFFNFKRELKDIGDDITYDMVRHCLRWLKDEQMISTSRSTRGMVIKVLKYDKYQTLDNYQSTSVSTSKAQEKHIESTPINKNDKNERMKECNIGKSPLKYKWQEEGLEASKWFKDGERFKSRILKAFKDNEKFATVAFNDCKELERRQTMYFFAVYNKINK